MSFEYKQYTIRLPSDLAVRVEKHCKALQIPVSKYLQDCIERILEADEETPPTPSEVSQ